MKEIEDTDSSGIRRVNGDEEGEDMKAMTCQGGMRIWKKSPKGESDGNLTKETVVGMQENTCEKT